MAASLMYGPEIISGNLTNIEAGVLSPEAVPDPNQDAGPSMFFMGDAVLDPRLILNKDKITGFTGVVQAHLTMNILESARIIPSALAAANIAAAANAVSGTAMTLAAANSLGITLGVPIRPFAASLNAASPVTAAIALDFGFGFGAAVSGSTTFTPGNILDYFVGMPLVIAGAGNAGGTIPLLTICVAVGTSTITLANAPLASNATAAVGTGDLWGPSQNGYPTPLAAYPFLASGPGLFLDARQALSRGVRITGVSGGAGGNFLISGWDVYGQPMSQLLTVGAGAVTGWSTKTFKYIGSVVPQFSDAHNYSVGTSDVFGMNYRALLYEDLAVFWAAAWMASTTGFTAADTTTPATNVRNDVRGTIQTSASGGGTGIGSTASNGSLTSNVMTGNRLEMASQVSLSQAVQATQLAPNYLFGTTQV